MAAEVEERRGVLLGAGGETGGGVGSGEVPLGVALTVVVALRLAALEALAVLELGEAVLVGCCELPQPVSPAASKDAATVKTAVWRDDVITAHSHHQWNEATLTQVGPHLGASGHLPGRGEGRLVPNFCTNGDPSSGRRRRR